MPADTPALRPCPWCGQKAILAQGKGVFSIQCRGGFHRLYKCDKCGVAPGTHGHKTPEAAIAAWNTRKEPDRE